MGQIPDRKRFLIRTPGQPACPAPGLASSGGRHGGGGGSRGPHVSPACLRRRPWGRPGPATSAALPPRRGPQSRATVSGARAQPFPCPRRPNTAGSHGGRHRGRPKASLCTTSCRRQRLDIVTAPATRGVHAAGSVLPGSGLSSKSLKHGFLLSTMRPQPCRGDVT